MKRYAILGAAMLALAGSPATAQSLVATGPIPAPSVKQRLIVLTDVGTEVDDQQSVVRLLLYANEIDIEGLVATTSSGLRDKVYPQMIEERVRAYGKVLPNLRVHAAGYPDAEVLLGRIRASTPTYGMAGVGRGKDTPASRLIIQAVDRPDPRPVWVTTWGGAKDLAQALWTVRATRRPAEVAKFVRKLRVYAISDQDDAGPWARTAFPDLFWITSIHALWDFDLSTWSGMSADVPGADSTLVRKPWLAANVQSKGPLGALYPSPVFGMEGDTPSFLHLLPNGLGSPEHPDWGGWGGRYGQLAGGGGLYTSATDRVRGIDGTYVRDNRATVWRWRAVVQNDFAARMDWTVQPAFKGANHPPMLRLNGAGGAAPLTLAACPGDTIRLSAAGSSDPDGQTLTYRWWQYREASGIYSPGAKIEGADSPDAIVTLGALGTSPKAAVLTSFKVHIILEATDGTLTRYRRAVISVPGADDFAASGKACPASPAPSQPRATGARPS